MEKQLAPLHLACKVDDDRPNMRLIHIKNGIAEATDGHIAVRIDLNLSGNLTPEQVILLNNKFIDMEVWKEIHNCDLILLGEDGISCQKNGITKMFDYSKPIGEWFNIDAIVLTIADVGAEAKLSICMSGKYVGILSKIFDTSDLFFNFSKGMAGILVHPGEHSGEFAVLMPINQIESNRYYFLT